MKRQTLYYCVVISGLLLIGAGIYLLLTTDDPQGVMRALPYVSIGLGCGLFGQGMGSLIHARQIRKNPQIARAQQIEKNDERNIAVNHRAKAKAWDVMIYVFAMLILAFVLIGAPLPIVLLVVAAYAFGIGLQLYYFIRYNKEM